MQPAPLTSLCAYNRAALFRMRFRALLLLLFIALAASCKKRHSHNAHSSAPSSVIAMNDRSVERQLTSGFHDVEANAWRWTAGSFSVDLAVPPAARRTGATLTLDLNVPEPNLKRLGPITLTSAAAGRNLPEERFTSSGPYRYQREIASDLLTGPLLHVDFHVDKTIPPSNEDPRELGIVVSAIRLTANPHP